MSEVVAVARIGLAAVLLVAAVGKLLDIRGARRALSEFEVPEWMAGPGALLLIGAELAAGADLLFQPTARAGGLVATLLFGVFSVGIARAVRGGRAPECHCFGQFHSAPAGRRTLVRNGILLAMGLLVVAAAPGTAVDRLFDVRSSAVSLTVLRGAVAVFLAGAIVWLQRANGALRSNLSGAVPTHLPVGTAAPPFVLVDGDDRLMTSADLLSAGTPLLLLFTSVACTQCQAFMPVLARWQRRLAGMVTIVPLSYGDREAGRAHALDHSVDGTLFLGEDRGLIDLYAIPVTPCGLLIGADGRIASAPIQGADAVDSLLDVIAHAGQTYPQALLTAAAGARR